MIYITGATGFIGSRVATRLLERGESLRCLVRSRKKAAWLADAGAELIEGDATDARTHERGVQGASGAIHLAAIYDIGNVNRSALWRTNVDGTRAFLAATSTVRSVFVSSTVALGPGDGSEEPRDAYEGPYHSVYHHTKAESHRLARAAQKSGAPLIIVCPAFVFGPNDEGPAGRLISDLRRRKLPALLTHPSTFSFAFVDDVADGIIAALDRGRVGEVYVLGGDAATLTDYAKKICAMVGVKPPALRLPHSFAKLASGLLDPVSRVTGIGFPITREAVTTTTGDSWVQKFARSIADLSYQPRSLEAGLARTLGDEDFPPVVSPNNA